MVTVEKANKYNTGILQKTTYYHQHSSDVSVNIIVVRTIYLDYIITVGAFYYDGP